MSSISPKPRSQASVASPPSPKAPLGSVGLSRFKLPTWTADLYPEIRVEELLKLGSHIPPSPEIADRSSSTIDVPNSDPGSTSGSPRRLSFDFTMSEAVTCASDIDGLTRVNNLLVEGRADYGEHAAVVRSPSAFETKPTSAVVDTNDQYHTLLRQITESRPTPTPRRIPGIPSFYPRFRDLSNHVLKRKPGRHGASLHETNSIIVLGDGAALMYISGNVRHMREVLRTSSENGSLEVALKSSPPLMAGFYYGSYKFIDVWFPFSRDVIGDLPELFAEETYSARSAKWAGYKLQWYQSEPDLQFCLFQYEGFNQDYFDLLVESVPKRPKRTNCDDKENGPLDKDLHRHNRMKVGESKE